MSIVASSPYLVAPGRSLLVVAHPGHELRLFGWMRAARPEVLVLTDGSGSIAQPRVSSSHQVLALAAATAGPLFGRYSDQEVYRALLAADHGYFAAIEAAIAARLGSGAFDAVVADPYEGYNPSHDLCSLLVNVARERVRRESGRRIAGYEYALTAPLPGATAPEGVVSLSLAGSALDDKIAAARNYPELQWEIDQALAREGMQAFAREELRPLDGPGLCLVPARLPPHYELHGERKRAEGVYADVIRYREHFVPVMEALVAGLPVAQR